MILLFIICFTVLPQRFTRDRIPLCRVLYTQWEADPVLQSFQTKHTITGMVQGAYKKKKPLEAKVLDPASQKQRWKQTSAHSDFQSKTLTLENSSTENLATLTSFGEENGWDILQGGNSLWSFSLNTPMCRKARMHTARAKKLCSWCGGHIFQESAYDSFSLASLWRNQQRFWLPWPLLGEYPKPHNI